MIFSVLSSLLMFLDSFPCIDNKFSRVYLEFFPFPSQNSCRLTRGGSATRNLKENFTYSVFSKVNQLG